MKPNLNASKRTKERFAQHAPFTVLSTGRCSGLGDQECLLLSSQKTKWMGWIPIAEIDGSWNLDGKATP